MTEARVATGRGTHVINRVIDELVEKGDIVILDDPIDKRKKMISREHLQIIIDTLRGK